MKTHKFALIAAFLVCLSEPAWANDISSIQQQFARNLVTSVPGIENAWWSQDISLWVKINITNFASNPELYAQQIADKLSVAAAIKFGHYLCVRVCYGEQRVLAKSCSSP